MFINIYVYIIQTYTYTHMYILIRAELSGLTKLHATTQSRLF